MGLTLDDSLDDLARKFNVTLEVSVPRHVEPDRSIAVYRTADTTYSGRDEFPRPPDRLRLHERSVSTGPD